MGEMSKTYAAIWRRNDRRGRGRFKYVKRQALRRGWGWSISENEYAALVQQPCEYCGLANDVEAGVGLDRLDNARGYELGNVVSCCATCNLVRGARFTRAEMKQLGEVIARIRLARGDTKMPRPFTPVPLPRYERRVGVLHHQAKLDPAKVLAIRAHIANGLKDHQIAELYSVRPWTITLVRRGVTWRHVGVSSAQQGVTP